MRAVISLARFFASHPLTRTSPIKAWSRVVSWQIKSRMRHEVLVPWIGGCSLAVKRGMTGATGNIYAGLHEFSDMMFLLHFLREGDLFLDIGANVGAYTVLASGVCKAFTSAFEPDPDTLLALRRNVSLNGLEDLVVLNAFALGHCEDELRFTVGLDTANRVAPAEQGNVRTIRQQMLDVVMEDTVTPVMIKIDVEGYEENVLLGAQSVLARDCLQAIELETVTPIVAEILHRNRFTRAYYDPFSRLLARQPIDVPSANSLYVRDFGFVGNRLSVANKVRIFDHAI
jgi:FkbM family methyltransferase